MKVVSSVLTKYNANELIRTILILVVLYMSKRFGAILGNVRSIVRKFRQSPIKNEVLQKRVEAAFGKSLKLQLDCKTRWNSTEAMLERYLKLFDCINETLVELKVENPVSREDADSMSALLEALRPIRFVSEAMGRRDATLLTAEGSLFFLFSKLKKQESPIALELYQAVRQRISERRNVKVVSVMRFLKDGTTTSTCEELPILPRAQIVKAINDDFNIFINPGEQERDGIEFVEKPKTLEEELQSCIDEHSGKNNQLELVPDRSKIIQKELNLFEASKQLPPNLKTIYGALSTIKPTSIESERIFSDVGNICTKKKASMSDDTIDTLSFLKSFFRAEDS